MECSWYNTTHRYTQPWIRCLNTRCDVGAGGHLEPYPAKHDAVMRRSLSTVIRAGKMRDTTIRAMGEGADTAYSPRNVTRVTTQAATGFGEVPGYHILIIQAASGFRERNWASHINYILITQAASGFGEVLGYHVLHTGVDIAF